MVPAERIRAYVPRFCEVKQNMVPDAFAPRVAAAPQRGARDPAPLHEVRHASQRGDHLLRVTSRGCEVHDPLKPQHRPLAFREQSVYALRQRQTFQLRFRYPGCEGRRRVARVSRRISRAVACPPPPSSCEWIGHSASRYATAVIGTPAGPVKSMSVDVSIPSVSAPFAPDTTRFLATTAYG